MTPCEEKGYKVGDRFRQIDVDGSPMFAVGEEIELIKDDATGAPLFKDQFGHKCHEDIDNVEPLTPQWRGPQDGTPPVGTKVTYRNNNGFIHDAEVLATHHPWVWLSVEETFLDTVYFSGLKPLQSDRERAIEEMTDIAGASMIGPRAVAEALYEAGYRKAEES